MIGRRFIIPVLALLFTAAIGAGRVSAFEFKGFADFNFSHSTQKNADQGEFSLGALDFYLSQPIDDRTDVLVEFVIESDDAGDFVVDLERLQFGYIASDAMKLRVGRFHNILGYWNTAYHHGAQLHTSIERPAFLEFEDDGGIIPTHIIGMWAAGSVKTAPAEVTYGLMLGNGSKVGGIASMALGGGSLNPNNTKDDTGNKAVSLKLRVEPSAIDGLGAGISGYHAVVKGYDTSDVEIMRIKQDILSLDLTYFSGNIEAMGEYYMIKDKDDLGGGASHTSSAYYIQGGYAIGNLTPYLRYENVSLDNGNDPYFSALGTVESKRTVAGARYNLSMMSAFKAEVRLIDENTTSGNYEQFALQWAFTF
ncbi:MAG: porin [Deltaproteobacteria bacterium]|nr:porin [Deltaproteobacteria bacterium]